jgi:hypothetical protein
MCEIIIDSDCVMLNMLPYNYMNSNMFVTDEWQKCTIGKKICHHSMTQCNPHMSIEEALGPFFTYAVGNLPGKKPDKHVCQT